MLGPLRRGVDPGQAQHGGQDVDMAGQGVDLAPACSQRSLARPRRRPRRRPSCGSETAPSPARAGPPDRRCATSRSSCRARPRYSPWSARKMTMVLSAWPVSSSASQTAAMWVSTTGGANRKAAETPGRCWSGSSLSWKGIVHLRAPAWPRPAIPARRGIVVLRQVGATVRQRASIAAVLAATVRRRC